MPQHPKNQGFQCYDWYHYLWHLIAIRALRVVAGSDAQYQLEADAWDLLNLPEGVLPGTGEIIAMIDTGVNDKHPNLAPRIRPSVDFAAHPFGATYGPQPAPAGAPPNALSQAATPQPMKRGLEEPLAASLVGAATWNWARSKLDPAGAALIDELRAGRGVKHRDAHISRQRYSGHGTACAGLMVGAPPPEGPQELPDTPSSVDDGPVPYWGVAPGAEVLPIIVSAEPTAMQLIFALLYARGKGVSVIHFPREAVDPRRAHKHSADLEESRYDSDARMKLAWDVFKRILEVVSDEIPVICAAGNNGYDHLIYPARKADANNGIISVGAVTYNAKRSSYSNYCRTGADCSVTIAAPSDDDEVYTRRQVRLDKESPRWREHNFMLHLARNPGLEVTYSPQALVTTDVPGPRGYSEGILASLSTEAVEEDDRAALYALFGGTSGASAIVAGAVALLQAKARAAGGGPLDGGAVKDKVKASGRSQVNWPWLVGSLTVLVDVETDKPNGEANIAFERQFGGGVLDLHSLLQ
jgi:subtilisin family serine protease